MSASELETLLKKALVELVAENRRLKRALMKVASCDARSLVVLREIAKEALNGKS